MARMILVYCRTILAIRIGLLVLGLPKTRSFQMGMDSKTGTELIVRKEIRSWLVEDHATAAHDARSWLTSVVDDSYYLK